MTTTIEHDRTSGTSEEEIEIELRTGEIAEPERWNDWVRRSPQGTALHRSEALAVVAEHAGATLHRLVGYDGGSPIGLVPVFELSFGPVTTIFSPPPGMGLSTLGPCLLTDGLEPGERVSVEGEFLASCWERLREAIRPRYVNVATAETIPGTNRLAVGDDVRIRPRFTYVLDVTPSTDELLDGFSSDARRNVRNADPDRYEIREGGHDAIERIVERMRARYEEQGLTYPVSADFVTALYDRLPDGMVRPYVITVDGEFANGLLALDDGETVSRWQGGGKADVDLPVNDLLDWHAIESAADRGRERYDFVGANNPRICEYKAKFNADLVAGHRIERSTAGTRVIRDVYRRLRDQGIAAKLPF